jgi:zinc-ribbon domain
VKDQERNDASKRADERATEIARKAARLFKTGRPRVQRLIADNRPRVEKVSRGALRYAQEHENEIKAAALRGARMRVRGPFGFVIDALGRASSEEPEQARPPDVCPGCDAVNAANARFCSQCGTRLNIED